jgi:hypothetical protein
VPFSSLPNASAVLWLATFPQAGGAAGVATVRSG